MRAVLIAVAVAALAALVAVAIDAPRAPTGERTPAQAAPPAPQGPFEVAATQPELVAARDAADTDADSDTDALPARVVSELAARLRADPAALRPHRRARGVARAARLADTARRMQRRTCASSLRRECHEAVARAAIRSLWRTLRPFHGPRRTAELLVGVGTDLRMTETEIANAVRAELDEALTTAVATGAVSARRRERAIACFDVPEDCGR
jgi:hypothetical protein